VSGMFQGIPGSDRWTSVDPVPKGWSKDTKYRVETEAGLSLLVRISEISEYPRKELEYDALRKLDGLPIVMTRPVDFGTFNDGSKVFTITTWIEGTDAESALPGLSVEEQYDLGWEAGRVLRHIHRIPAPPGQPEWAERFNRKIDRNIRNYEACGIEVPGADKAIRHINSLRHLLEGRPQVFQHGDYHCGNMIITPDGQIGIIDFNRLDYGDPWEEFNRIVWCAAVSGAFASGRIDGYFADAAEPECDSKGYSEAVPESSIAGRIDGCSDGRVPHEFFQLMSLYVASNMLSSVPWAIPFGQGEVEVMLKQAESVSDWYDGFRSCIPRWYVGRKGPGQ
jgi:aminoglycoside phosphotransferase (APT) family kinase protein